MKAITICQPYAHMISIGQKSVENRGWPTKYRGQLLIHAGKSLRWANGYTKRELQLAYGEPLAFGAVVAIATLHDCLPADEILAGKHDVDPHPMLSANAHVSGPWCWVLTEVKRIHPVPTKGRQGLFDVPWVPTCRICGCTDDHACPGGCYWVEPDLCSACRRAIDHPK